MGMIKAPKFNANASKSALRDSLKRLKKLRQACGKNDEEDQAAMGSGDPFRDLASSVAKDITELKDAIIARNEEMKKHGNDSDTIENSHEINKSRSNIRKELEKLQTMVNAADAKLAKYNKKKRSANKIELMERQVKDMNLVYKTCSEAFETAEKMNEERFAAKNGATQVDMKKMKLRTTLMAAGVGTKYSAPEGGAEVSSGNGGRLEDQPEYKEHMAKIKQQDKQMDAMLDRIRGTVGRLKDTALQIGNELDTHNAMLDNTQNRMEDQTKQLKNINRRLKKITEASKPMNTFINIGCVLLLVAIVGYFLFQFNIV